jgi:hypothetical protein
MASVVVDSAALRCDVLEAIRGQVARGVLAVAVDIDGNWLRFRRMSTGLVVGARFGLVPTGVERFVQHGRDWGIHIVTLGGEHLWTCDRGYAFSVGFQ